MVTTWFKKNTWYFKNLIGFNFHVLLILLELVGSFKKSFVKVDFIVIIGKGRK